LTGTEPGFSEQAGNWYHQGASVIGGCCRIGPEEIPRLAKRLQGYSIAHNKSA
jgi:homocysteine S-methyltransferase